ncbi:MAG: flavin reductase family protein [Roseobacter sp.]
MGDLPQAAAAAITFEPTPDQSRALRRAFATFGTGVTVITTQTPHGPLAMTANSFSSISLDPALVLWSPAKKSQRHDAFTQAERFCIHVLSTAQQNMAHHFARDGLDFAPFDWQEGPFGAPELGGCLAAFHCDTFAVHPAGDHSIVIGQIQRVVQADLSTAGLLFSDGAFGQFTRLEGD